MRHSVSGLGGTAIPLRRTIRSDTPRHVGSGKALAARGLMRSRHRQSKPRFRSRLGVSRPADVERVSVSQRFAQTSVIDVARGIQPDRENRFIGVSRTELELGRKMSCHASDVILILNVLLDDR